MGPKPVHSQPFIMSFYHTRREKKPSAITLKYVLHEGILYIYLSFVWCVHLWMWHSLVDSICTTNHVEVDHIFWIANKKYSHEQRHPICRKTWRWLNFLWNSPSCFFHVYDEIQLHSKSSKKKFFFSPTCSNFKSYFFHLCTHSSTYADLYRVRKTSFLKFVI